MPISIGQWHNEIENFNSFKCKTSFKTEHDNFMVYLSLYRVIIIIFSSNILHYLLIILITDNFAIQVNNLITPVISVYKSFKTKLIRTSFSLQFCLILNYLTELFLNLILQDGDIETNPGPRGEYSQYISFCHWNLLNSLPAHNYARIPLLQTFNTLHKFHFHSQKHIMILQFQLRRSLLLLMVINYFVLTIPVILKVVEYVYIIKNLYLLKF